VPIMANPTTLLRVALQSWRCLPLRGLLVITPQLVLLSHCSSGCCIFPGTESLHSSRRPGLLHPALCIFMCCQLASAVLHGVCGNTRIKIRRAPLTLTCTWPSLVLDREGCQPVHCTQSAVATTPVLFKGMPRASGIWLVVLDL